jgi:predicted  nucleic acid-binding Zn-ribbon protein
VKAAPEAQLRLLDLQALDTRLDQLAHRRATLPETAELARVDAEMATVRDDIVRLETADGDLAREQTKIEVELVRGRAVRDQQRLDAGQVGSPRELENLQHEIGSLAKRQADLEDQILELMERRETVQNRLAERTADRDRLRAMGLQLEAKQGAAFAEIEAESAELTGRRAELADGLPTDVLTLYEKVRSSSGGVGAARLYRGQCQGCHLSLSGSDLAAVRAAAPDELVRCEECRRILVRTADSGV